MASEYWSRVGKKVKKLGKTAAKLAAPVAVDIAITQAVQKVCNLIQDKLKKMFKRTGINSAISFGINLCGLLILILKPFGKTVSKFVTYGFFSAAFVFWLVRTILFVKNYGKIIFEVTKQVFKDKSLYLGIEHYVLLNFPLISLGYAGVNIAAEYIPYLKEVPQISELVKYIVKIFWKRVALFAGIMATYTIMVFWIVKPILVRRYM